MAGRASNRARSADRTGAYVAAVLDLVDTVPPGQATTYGDLAEVLTDVGLGGGPRTVGAVMSRHGGAVAWWRVVRSDGSPNPADIAGALERHRREGTPLRGERVDLSRARAVLSVPPASLGG